MQMFILSIGIRPLLPLLQLFVDQHIMSTPSYSLFCLGNPLLDVQVTNGEELLKKYDLKANDAILAEEKHAPMYVSIRMDLSL